MPGTREEQPASQEAKPYPVEACINPKTDPLSCMSSNVTRGEKIWTDFIEVTRPVFRVCRIVPLFLTNDTPDSQSRSLFIWTSSVAAYSSVIPPPFSQGSLQCGIGSSVTKGSAAGPDRNGHSIWIRQKRWPQVDLAVSLSHTAAIVRRCLPSLGHIRPRRCPTRHPGAGRRRRSHRRNQEC